MPSNEQHLLATEIVDRGIESSGPNAGSPTFSVRVRRRLPDFVQSVNLKYVKLGYHYLINHGVYLATIPVLVLVFGAEVGSLSREELWRKLWEDARDDLATVLSFFGVFVFTLSVYFMSRPRSIYLVDFACYKPHDDLKVISSFPHVLACMGYVKGKEYGVVKVAYYYVSSYLPYSYAVLQQIGLLRAYLN